ncbi:hypothetical protein KBY83_14000 [Cyanobium sp. WKJ7-Wakatipu]|uniref:hypothetical protein n=1 Tax=Cyanobium sp. WKJ7-Wakatipu TaxID=2823726 RepID=UPI0020CE6B54|nr:hypothetical protein [Cyanobium sp. WKJ7-Wakatipu]MCP9784409.1 hypothetical protein [Cyanobium sp. WKJ7-Wakatipu]
MVTPVRHDLSDPAIPEGMVRISAGSEHRYIWPVHLGGWQSLGWQLQEAAAELPDTATTGAIDLVAPLAPEPGQVAQPVPAVEPAVVPEPNWGPEAEPAAEPEPEAATAPTPVPAPMPAPDFQPMNKAQILEHCSSVYGVELDGSQTKTELVEQATALAQLPVELLDGPSHP